MDFYGTIGPACADVKLLQQMVEAGMTGIRMNLSHGPLAAHKDWLALLRKAGVKKLLIDLQGPELRIGRLPQPLSLTAGQTVRLGAQGIPCPAALVHSVQPGQELLLDDGKLLARVDAVEPEALVCTVVRGGVLQSRKSLAAPGADIQMPTLTAEDKENLAIAAGCGVTGVMLPFVRGAADICNLRQALAEAGAPQLKILAKIENLAGVQALPEFLPLVDEVVIARGDLGNAMPLWEKLIDSPYVHNIVDYPKKTYSTRLEENGILYDFAAVARADAPGILITYIQKDNEDIGDLTVDSLLKDFPLELGGIATITENGRVISSNSSKIRMKCPRKMPNNY